MKYILSLRVVPTKAIRTSRSVQSTHAKNGDPSIALVFPLHFINLTFATDNGHHLTNGRFTVSRVHYPKNETLPNSVGPRRDRGGVRWLMTYLLVIRRLDGNRVQSRHRHFARLPNAAADDLLEAIVKWLTAHGETHSIRCVPMTVRRAKQRKKMTKFVLIFS